MTSFIEHPVKFLAEIGIADIDNLHNEYLEILEDPDNDPLQGDTYYTIRRLYNILLLIQEIAQ